MQIAYALVGALAFALLYWVGRRVRTFMSWTGREEPPKERTEFYLPFFAVVGGVIGFLSYDPVQAVLACQTQAMPLVGCLMGS